jgi:hypothetical protein
MAFAPSAPAKVLPGRWVEAWIPHNDAVVTAVYGPLRNEPYKRFWEAALAEVPAMTGESYALAGDGAIAVRL